MLNKTIIEIQLRSSIQVQGIYLKHYYDDGLLK